MQQRRTSLLWLLTTLCAASTAFAAGPPLKVAADGFPTGHTTPEGPACDLERAAMKGDAKLFRSACLPLFGGGENRQKYAAYLKETAASLTARLRQAKGRVPLPNGPQAIGKVYASRALSQNGPASYGYSVFGFQDVRFVDVGMELSKGKRGLNRILVIRADNGRWYAHPAPEIHPLLSAGLNQEEASTKDFSQAYTVHK